MMSFYINLWHTRQTPADILSCFSYSVCCTRTQTHVHRHTHTDTRAQTRTAGRVAGNRLTANTTPR